MAKSFTYFKRHTTNSIDDTTGEKVKLDMTSRRWDGFQVTELNMEPRQPQDFPVTPRAPKVYPTARTNDGPVDPPVVPLVLPGES